MVWHYEAADPEYGKMQGSELAKYLEEVCGEHQKREVDVTKYDYNRIVEIKPKGINKGVCVKVILERLFPHSLLSFSHFTPLNVHSRPALPLPLFLLCVGDDLSDEEMFEAVQSSEREGSNPVSPSLLARNAPPSGAGPVSLEGTDRLVTGHTSAHADSAIDAGPHNARFNPFSRSKRMSGQRNNVFTCCVGMRPSKAHYFLHDPSDVLEVLDVLANASQDRF